MASATNGTNTITYGYDANGLRHTKTVDGVVYTYYYAGDKLVRETFGSTVIDFFYDPDGRPYAMKYNGLVLYYVLNQQGDVVRLVDSEGVNYGTYKYDAWGNILQMPSTNYIKNNPLRYRGYVYDTETGLYYLQSRYYDPKIGRFINADGLVSTGQGILGNNMFTYCLNNPVLHKDSTGCYPLQAAFEFLFDWVFGDGEDENYNEDSSIVKALKKSSKMKARIDSAIEGYKNGIDFDKGTGEFTSYEDGWELYLATQHFDYTITVQEETRTVGFWWWKHEEVRYTATVVVHDTYNFDEFRDWNSFGSIMNNLAYIYHILGGGNDFEWHATYTYSTQWADVN